MPERNNRPPTNRAGERPETIADAKRQAQERAAAGKMRRMKTHKLAWDYKAVSSLVTTCNQIVRDQWYVLDGTWVDDLFWEKSKSCVNKWCKDLMDFQVDPGNFFIDALCYAPFVNAGLRAGYNLYGVDWLWWYEVRDEMFAVLRGEEGFRLLPFQEACVDLFVALANAPVLDPIWEKRDPHQVMLDRYAIEAEIRGEVEFPAAQNAPWASIRARLMQSYQEDQKNAQS